MSYMLYQKIILAARKVYLALFPVVNDKVQNATTADFASQLISKKIESGKPLMISRFGAVEIGAISNYIGIKSKKHNVINIIRGNEPEWWWNEGIRRCMKNNAGFFSNDNANLEKFAKLMLEDMKKIDVLLSWQPQEKLFDKELKYCKKIGFIWVDPFWSKEPWTKSLENKKVLVIHPFAQEIEDQYRMNRTKIHKNPDILPNFSLKVIKAVQSIGGCSEFKTWFDALEFMERQIDAIDFDICLLGCGAYGMPLAAYIKRKGKQAIHFGGSLQLLFGIKGKRWETTEYGKDYFSDKVGKYPTLMNEFWIRPYETSNFDAAKKVENGCYW